MKDKMTKADAVEELEELEELLTERISELYQVKGAQCARHSFILYRKKLRKVLWEYFK